MLAILLLLAVFIRLIYRWRRLCIVSCPPLVTPVLLSPVLPLLPLLFLHCRLLSVISVATSCQSPPPSSPLVRHAVISSPRPLPSLVRHHHLFAAVPFIKSTCWHDSLLQEKCRHKSIIEDKNGGVISEKTNEMKWSEAFPTEKDNSHPGSGDNELSLLQSFNGITSTGMKSLRVLGSTDGNQWHEDKEAGVYLILVRCCILGQSTYAA